MLTRETGRDLSVLDYISDRRGSCFAWSILQLVSWISKREGKVYKQRICMHSPHAFARSSSTAPAKCEVYRHAPIYFTQWIDENSA